MSNQTIASRLEELRSEIKVKKAPASPAAKKHERDRRTARPSFGRASEIPDAVEHVGFGLDAIWGAAFGTPCAAEWGRNVLKAVRDNVAATEEGLPEERVHRKALSEVVRRCGDSLNPGTPRGTRGLEVYQMLASMKAHAEDGGLVGIQNGKVVPVKSRKIAATVAAVWEATGVQALPEGALKDAEIALLLPEKSIRNDRLRALRSRICDPGLGIFLAALESRGFTPAGYPKFDLVLVGFPTLAWSESVLLSAHRVAENLQGWDLAEVFVRYFDGEDGAPLTSEYVRGVRKWLEPLERDAARGLEKALKKANVTTDEYREASQWYTSLVDQCDEARAALVEAIDLLLSLVRFKRTEKEDRDTKRAVETASTHGVGSTLTVESAVALAASAGAGAVEGAEVDEVPPVAIAAAFDVQRRDVVEVLQLEELGGGWVCDGYPGVVWELALPPMHGAMDLNRESDEGVVLVLAPRRVGQMGLELKEARWITLRDFSAYWSRADELASL